MGAEIYVDGYGAGRVVEYVDYPDGHTWKVRLDDGREIEVTVDEIVSAGSTGRSRQPPPAGGPWRGRHLLAHGENP